jgi:YD repeat-containing protein
VAIEGLRKHSTTLFSGRLAGSFSRHAELLKDHANLTNHQLCVVASETLTGGKYIVKVIPDTDGAVMAVDTGLVIDLTDKDSDMITFTGVIRGLFIQAIEPVPETEAAMYAVLSSFSRYKRSSIEDNRQDRLDYVSSDIAISKDTGFSALSKLTPNNANLIYHQIQADATGELDDVYEVRIIPDTDVSLPNSVSTGVLLTFETASSAMIRFGAVLRGIELRAVTLLSEPAKVNIVLSSSVERFDEIVYDYIGVPAFIDDHLTDFDNPHQTNWDNLLNKPDSFVIHEHLPAGEELVIPLEYQLLVWERYEAEGSLIVGGKLVILNELPITRATDPDFTYNIGGNLTQIDYAAGEQKLFTYNGSGQLIQVDSLRDGTTLRKSFTYTGGGELDYITETWL